MADRWFAECLPCKWETTHDTQDQAIRAAEDHVYEYHRNMPPGQRLTEYVGHVQNRTVNATRMSLEELKTAIAGDT